MNIEAQKVSWVAGGTPIVREVTASFASGAVTAIVGPNGSGKTTLLHLLAGLLTPSAGIVVHNRRDVRALSPRERARRVAVVQQHATTNHDLTVREVVELGRMPHEGIWGSRTAATRFVDEAMRTAGVTHLSDRGWSGLSGGEQQRVSLARALAQTPDVLLLDEPTNHLDIRHQIELVSHVAGLGITVIMVLHDLDLAAAFCPRIAVMSAGGLVAQGATARVLTPELIAEVFAIKARVRHGERLRVLWEGIIAVGGAR